ncbi:MAG: chromate efflux transporter [Marmoricola sp.]
MSRPDQREVDVVSLRESTRIWFLISLQTFGGPAGQIAVMQHYLVDRLRWIGQRRFLHALNYCMLLPGPEAQQLAIYTGWLLNGVAGGLIAGTLFVLPGFIAMVGLSWTYAVAGESALVIGIFSGLAPAVIAIVIHALWRVGSRTLTTKAEMLIALGAFVALSVLGAPFPIVIVVAGLIGWFTLAPRATSSSEGEDAGPPPLIADDLLHAARPSRSRAALILVLTVTVWLLPVVLVSALAPGSIFSEQGWFFAGTAVVTFGGAYAVLSYVSHMAVSVFNWLLPADMVRGLALAETTPGPLILVVQFVAFVSAYRHPGALDPWLAGVLASALVVWVTFVPCFGFIFLGAPYVERLRHHQALGGALRAVTAAVVGVIANLAIFFAVHTLFARTRVVDLLGSDLTVPVWSTWQPPAIVITIAGLALLFGARWSPLRTLLVCATAGLGWSLI